MSPNIGAGRPVRSCLGCGGEDDHPRHLVDVGDPNVDVAWHLDCHARAGCDSCAGQVAGADGVTGADMLAHLQKGT